jgi:predicted RNA polymerase sigma factor
VAPAVARDWIANGTPGLIGYSRALQWGWEANGLAFRIGYQLASPSRERLYDQLLAVAPTPVVALNRAIAIGEVQGPAAALALVDELDLDNYHPYHATRADLLARLGRHSEAAAAYQRAAALAPTDAERDFLRLGGRASR